jgi:hypothetical protein
LVAANVPVGVVAVGYALNAILVAVYNCGERAHLVYAAIGRAEIGVIAVCCGLAHTANAVALVAQLILEISASCLVWYGSALDT